MDWAHCKYTRDLRILISRYPWIFEAFHTFLQIHLLAHIHVSCIHLTWVDDFIFVVFRYGHFYMFISYLQYANIPSGHPSICVSVFVGLSTMGSWSYIYWNIDHIYKMFAKQYWRSVDRALGPSLFHWLDSTKGENLPPLAAFFLMFSTSNVRSCMLIMSTETFAVVFQTPDPLVQNWSHVQRLAASCERFPILGMGKQSEKQRKRNHPIERMDDCWLDVLLFATLTLACRFAVEALIDNMQKRERWGGCKLIDKVCRVCKWI